MKRFLTLIAVITACHAFAQDRTITGKVTSSEDQKTIPGVSVYLKGTTVATSTDIDGNYKLVVPASGKTIVFSSVGMKTKEVELGASNVIDAAMESDVLKLNEVVVTALGIEREKKSLGYSSQSVGGDELAKAREVNVVNSIASKVAGVQVNSSAGVPGASSKIILRGNKSFTEENQPLFVIDGIPLDNQTLTTNYADYPFPPELEGVNYSNRAIDINPDDIESINVLKGPAAAILYGIRAANGAIIITTKRAKYGQPTEVVVSSSVSWDKVDILPPLQNTYAQGFGGGVLNGTPTYSTYRPGPDGVFDPLNPNNDDIDGTSQSWGPTLASLGITPTDNVKDFFQTGITNENNFSVSTGTDKNSYRLSVGRLTQTGIVPNTNFERFSSRLTVQSQLSQKFSATSTVNYINDGGIRAQQGSNLSGVMLSLLRSPASFDLANGYEWPNGAQRTYLSFYDNPYFTVYNNLFKDDNQRVLASVAVNYFPYDWLKVTFRPGTDFYTDKRKGVFAIGANDDQSGGHGQITENSKFHQEMYYDLLFTATRQLTSKINGIFIIGNNVDQRFDEDIIARGRNLAIAKFYNLSNASDLYAEESKTRARNAAWFGDFSFGFDNKIFLGLSGREEWASTLGINNRSFFFPGANLAIVLTELKALKSASKVLSFAKLRAAYATAGNSGAFAYASTNTYGKPFFTDGFTSGFSFPYLGENGYGISNIIANPDLKPELTKGLEFGGEFKLYNDRISLDVTYYDQKTTNILLQRPVPFSTGHAVILDNAGELENKGWEIQLGLVPIKTRSGFEWNISTNYTSNKNEVTKLAEGVKALEIKVGFGDPGVFAKIGYPYGEIYGTTWARNSNGDLLIDDATGLPIKSDTLSAIGDGYPKYTMGIRNTFSYKNFTLSGLLDISHGAKIANGTHSRLNRLGRSEETADREHQYIIPGVKQSDGSPNDIPVNAVKYYQFYKGDAGATENWIEDASWVRIRELSLSYLIKKLGTKHIKSIEITLTARNLKIWTDFWGMDPENSLTGAGSNYSAVNWFGMPNTKSYVVGVKVTL